MDIISKNTRADNLNLFYKFLVKFTDFCNTNLQYDEMDVRLNNYAKAGIFPEIHGEINEMYNMTAEILFLTKIMHTVIFFHESGHPHLHDVNYLFATDETPFYVYPDRVFDIAKYYRASPKKLQKTLLKYLQPMFNLSCKIIESVSDAVILIINENNRQMQEPALAAKHSDEAHTHQANLLKGNLRNLTNDKTGTIDSVVDVLFGTMRADLPDDEPETQNDQEKIEMSEVTPDMVNNYINTHMGKITDITNKTINAFAKKICEGDLDPMQFGKISQSLMNQFVNRGEAMNTTTQPIVDVERLKGLYRETNGNIAGNVDMGDMIKNIMSIMK